MLSKYLESPQYKYIVWAYGFHGHRKSNFIKIMAALRELKAEFDFMPIILTGNGQINGYPKVYQRY